eukprot:15345222-Ditylum_brightwellii.AAC.1
MVDTVQTRMLSTMLKELNITKPITNNIDTSNSIAISTITGEGNITMMLKDNVVKEISKNNTNSTAISLQDSSSENASSDSVEENNNANEVPHTALTQKKTSTLTKAALIQCRKSARNAKKGEHFDADLDDPGDSVLQE